jgi:hypothetical protein
MCSFGIGEFWQHITKVQNELSASDLPSCAYERHSEWVNILNLN